MEASCEEFHHFGTGHWVQGVEGFYEFGDISIKLDCLTSLKCPALNLFHFIALPAP